MSTPTIILWGEPASGIGHLLPIASQSLVPSPRDRLAAAWASPEEDVAMTSGVPVAVWGAERNRTPTPMSIEEGSVDQEAWLWDDNVMPPLVAADGGAGDETTDPPSLGDVD